MRKKLALVTVGVTVMALTAACTSSSTKTNNSKTGSSSKTASGPASGGTLKVGLTLASVKDSFDTAYTIGGGENDRWVGQEIYDGLTKYDLSHTDPNTVPGVVGDLASSWTVNSNATLYTFKIRPNVKFTDGTPWNADAAVFNLDRYTDTTAPQFDKALSADAGFYTGGIGKVTKVDDTTFTVATKGNQPYSFLIQDLTLLPMGSPTAIKASATNFAKHPVGTGPFKLVSSTPGQNIVLERNPDYWAGAAKLDKIELIFLPDNTARVAALKKGEVNLIESTPPDELAGLKAAGYGITQNAYANVYRCVFDTSKAPWNNADLRKAANMALDREALTKSVLDGAAIPAVQAASTADPGYNPSLNTTLGYNLEKAKALVAKAGVSTPIDATFAYIPSGSGGSPDPSVVMPVLQADMAKIGIKVKPVAMTNQALNTDQFSGKMPGGASAGCWIGTQVLPSLWQVFVTKNFLNDGKYSNPIVDKAFSDAKAATTQAGQAKYLGILNTQEAQDAAWLYIATDVNPRAYAPSVHNFVAPKSWFQDIRNVTVG